MPDQPPDHQTDITSQPIRQASDAFSEDITAQPVRPPAGIVPGDEEPIGWQDDPSMRRSRREAFMILGLWCCCFVWTCTYCYLYGYLTHEPMPQAKATGPDIAAAVGELRQFNLDTPEKRQFSYPLGLGIPDWVVWGVVVPWTICVILSTLFCLFIFTEDRLAPDGEPDE